MSMLLCVLLLMTAARADENECSPPCDSTKQFCADPQTNLCCPNECLYGCGSNNPACTGGLCANRGCPVPLACWEIFKGGESQSESCQCSGYNCSKETSIHCNLWDGCPGRDVCGCPAGKSCIVNQTSVNGICDFCNATANCQGKECGPDGCGGQCSNSCGSDKPLCTPEGACCASTCNATSLCIDVDCNGNWCQTCDANEYCILDQTADTYGQCCKPNCPPGKCGIGNCGQRCGCKAGFTCNKGACVPEATCTKDCTGKTCGDDGCGKSCGSCGDREYCSNYKCVKCKDSDADTHPECCTPSCKREKPCGKDGCGGSCGTCTPPETCHDDGHCRGSNDSSPPDNTLKQVGMVFTLVTVGLLLLCFAGFMGYSYYHPQAPPATTDLNRFSQLESMLHERKTPDTGTELLPMTGEDGMKL